jgi:ABC-type branched-subunit amino acid transport system substrate-binding protein
MAGTGITRPSKWTVCFVALVVLTLGLGEAGSATAAGGEPKDLGHGVSAKEIKLGIAIVDYDAIKDFVDFERGDQQKTAQVFVDYINKNGGVGGRKIVPFYKTYPPIPGQQPDPLSLCTSWTEDDGVFAVLGVFIDFTGQGLLCLTKEHNTIHIGHELEQPWIDESPPGLLLTPDTTKESTAKVLITLVSEQGKFKGKKVAILADQNSEGRANDTIKPALKKAGVKTGTTAVLSVAGTDTTAAQAQLESFVEKWKGEGVNAVFLAGLSVSGKQYVETIKQALPKALLITDAEKTSEAAQDEVKAGNTPNPYEGILSTRGDSLSDRWAHKSPLLQQCVDIYEKATGTKVPGPDKPAKNSAGKTIELSVAVTDFCGELMMFKTIAERVGPDLTNKNWQKTVNSFGKIDLVVTDITSLCKGKYAADDAFRLLSFDSNLGTNGDWKAATEVRDASGGQCTKAAK